MLTTSSPMIVGPTDGEAVTLQTIGVRFMIPGADTDSRVTRTCVSSIWPGDA